MTSPAVELARRAGLRSIQRQHFALHDVGFGLWDPRKGFRRYAEGLRKHQGVVTAHPVADAERAMFRIKPIVKRENGVTRRRTEGLNRVAKAFREIPEIAGAEIDDFGLALGVDHRHLAMSFDDVRPFGGIVPMHFAGAARVEKQMRTGNMGGNRKPARGDFPRPATGRGLDRPLVEGRREDDRVAGLSRNCFQIIRRRRNIIARGMSIGRSPERL